jgi:hypothetical protein
MTEPRFASTWPLEESRFPGGKHSLTRVPLRIGRRAASIRCAELRHSARRLPGRGLRHARRASEPGHDLRRSRDIGADHGEPDGPTRHFVSEPVSVVDRARPEPEPRDGDDFGRTVTGSDDRAEARGQDGGDDPER